MSRTADKFASQPSPGKGSLAITGFPQVCNSLTISYIGVWNTLIQQSFPCTHICTHIPPHYHIIYLTWDAYNVEFFFKPTFSCGGKNALSWNTPNLNSSSASSLNHLHFAHREGLLRRLVSSFCLCLPNGIPRTRLRDYYMRCRVSASGVGGAMKHALAPKCAFWFKHYVRPFSGSHEE